jgi:three-Cys-motif partner protein
MSGKYIWQPGGTPPDIDPHSRAKHEVLAGYLRRYIEVVTANRRMDVLRMTLVDGFAGGGEYREPETRAVVPGSPLIMIDAMADAAAALVAQQRRKQLHLDVRYIFVEKEPSTAAYLSGNLTSRGHGARVGQDIELLRGSFE